jgi:hypothetical protein
MRTLLRLCFVSLMVLAIASQYAVGREGVVAADAQGRLFDGLRRLNLHIDPSPTDGVITARSPSCEAPIQLTLARIDGGDADTLTKLRSPNDDIRYVYLGSADAQRNQISMLLRWSEAHALFVLGLAPIDAPSRLVFVVLPKNCPDLAALPWSTLSPGT